MVHRGEVRDKAARVLEPFLTGSFKRQDRAKGLAESLAMYGYLLGSETRRDTRDRVANDLGCRMDWPVAVKAATALDEAGLLAVERSS